MSKTNLTLTTNVKKMAKSLGADMVGIADAKAFERAPEGLRATDFLPSAKSIVVMGRRQPMTVILRGDKKRTTLLAAVSYMTLNNMITEVTRYLEDKGYEAYPIYHVYFVTGATPGDRIEKRFDLSYKHAAVEAGLGEMGLSNLLLTPKYGPAVRLTIVLTNAPLKCEPKFEGKICKKDEGCRACVEACPSGAISEQGILDKQKCYEYLAQDYERFHYGSCLRCMSSCAQVLSRNTV